VIRTSDNEAAYSLLREHQPERNGDTISVLFRDQQQVASIPKTLIQNNVDVYLLQPKANDLEQLFIDLTTMQS
jgi:hypothetical protein